MKIMTLNLHCYAEDNPVENFKYIADYIYQNDVDIVCFQEVAQHIDSEIIHNNVRIDNPLYIMKNYIQQKYQVTYDYSWCFSNYGFNVYEEGLGIFSKHAFLESDTRYISKIQDVNDWHSRNIIYSKLNVNNQIFNVFSCHLCWWDSGKESFIDQFNNLNQFVASKSSSETDEVFLAGDFNNHAESEGYQYMVDKGYIDQYLVNDNSTTDMTFVTGQLELENENAGTRIDYILTKKGHFKSKDAKVIFKNRRVSDHYAVIVSDD